MVQTIRIDEHTWRFEDGGVRFFLLEGTRSAMLIDSGMMCPDAREIAQKVTDLHLVLLNTHADPDHISGNGSFDVFYMSAAEEPNYRAHKGEGRLFPIKEGDVIDLGDRPLEVIDIPGHTPGSVAVLDVNNRILISGDSVQAGNIFMFKSHRNMDLFIKSMEHLEEYRGRFDVIYPSHGDFPVEPDLIGKLHEGAQEIRAGKAQWREVDMHGTRVRLYSFPYAGFYCDL